MNQLNKFRRLSCLFLFLIARSTIAQDTVTILTLKDAIALARANSTILKIDSINELSARKALSISTQGALPSLTLNANYLRLSDNVTPFRVAFPEGQVTLNPQILNQSYNHIQLRQLIFSGGRLRNGIRQSSIGVEIARHDREKSEREVLYGVIELWYGIFNLNQTVRAIDESITALKSRRQEVMNLSKAGLALNNDVLKVDIALTNLESQKSDLVSQTNTLKYTLSVLLGIDEKPAFELPSVLPEDAIREQSKDAWLAQALMNRPELKSIQLIDQQTELSRKIANAEYLPTVSIGGTANYDRPNQRIFPNRAEFDGTWTAGVFLSWNISSLYTNAARVAQARFAETKAEKLVSQVRDQVRVEVFEAVEKYEQAKVKVSNAEKLVAQATENFKIEENRLKQQVISVTDYLMANEQLIQAEVALIQSKVYRELAHQNLLKVTHN